MLYLGDDSCQQVADFLHVIEVIGKWRAAACVMFFLLPSLVRTRHDGSRLTGQIQGRSHCGTRVAANTDKAIRNVMHVCDGNLCVSAVLTKQHVIEVVHMQHPILSEHDAKKHKSNRCRIQCFAHNLRKTKCWVCKEVKIFVAGMRTEPLNSAKKVKN